MMRRVVLRVLYEKVRALCRDRGDPGLEERQLIT
jgi:hypothetical protein